MQYIILMVAIVACKSFSRRALNSPGVPLQAEVVPTCRELGIGIVAYSPLGRGFLGGKYRDRSKFAPDDLRTKQPRFQDENFNKVGIPAISYLYMAMCSS